MKILEGNAEIFDFFRCNQTPLYYISTTLFNVIGADEWINNLHFINTIDSFDGQHPPIFAASPPPGTSLPGIEATNNYLLRHPAVIDHLRRTGLGGVLFLMFSPQTEALAQALGLSLALPSAALRDDLDNKITTTRLANRAGIASVPNVLARVDSYRSLREVSQSLGNDLVVQLPFGDSGATTFFISTEADYRRYADKIEAQPEVKVMKRIRPRQTTIEGCVTRYGTFVGPLMTELVGFPELTPYPGGWCGNEVFCSGTSTLITPQMRQHAQQIMLAMGEQLRHEGFWGCFNLDLLLDEDTGALYLGEMNPRITGASPLTNWSALDQGEPPLLLFHLLEWLGVRYSVNIEAFNQRWVADEETTQWGQLIVESLNEDSTVLTHVPRSGIYEMQPDGTVCFSRLASQPMAIADESEAFLLRTIDAGYTAVRGGSIGRLALRGRVITDDYQLTDRAKAWIKGVRALFTSPSAAE